MKEHCYYYLGYNSLSSVKIVSRKKCCNGWYGDEKWWWLRGLSCTYNYEEKGENNQEKS